MAYGMIATWRMAFDGVEKNTQELAGGKSAETAIVDAIKMVEDYPYYKSVGFGGLPNENGIVELDAAFMHGDTLEIGAVAGIQDIKNPVAVAAKLSKEKFNSFRVGSGASEYAKLEGFEATNMLTDRAKAHWEKRLKEMQEKHLSPYDGHDTIGMVALDTKGTMTAATSSSGLFMKKNGRVGDSPLSGSGFYVDSEIGGATATGLGEDLMKGCLSYEIVRKMGEGFPPQEAADKTVYPFAEHLEKKQGKAGAFSLVCMNNKGEWGVATNVEFSFAVATEKTDPEIYLAYPGENHTTVIEVADQAWLDAYEKRIKTPIDQL